MLAVAHLAGALERFWIAAGAVIALLAAGILSGTIKLIEPLGEVTLAYVDIGVGEEPVVVKLQGNRMLERGAAVSLAAEPGKLHAFDTQGRAIR